MIKAVSCSFAGRLLGRIIVARAISLFISDISSLKTQAPPLV